MKYLNDQFWCDIRLWNLVDKCLIYSWPSYSSMLPSLLSWDLGSDFRLATLVRVSALSLNLPTKKKAYASRCHGLLTYVNEWVWRVCKCYHQCCKSSNTGINRSPPLSFIYATFFRQMCKIKCFTEQKQNLRRHKHEN